MRARPAILIGAAGFAAHLAANPHYGFFRDELYFIVCGRHPDFGYADQPPLAPLLAAGSQVFGTSLFLMRAVPAACAGLTAWAAGLLAAEIGGGGAAEALAALLVLLSPVLAAFGTMLGPDGVQMPLWTAAALCTARAIARNPRWMLAAGLLLGCAAEAKYTSFLFGAALAAGLLAGGHARLALSRAGLGGAALALLVAAPSLVWQYAHGWPFAELLRAGHAGKNVLLGPAGFLGQQILLTHPLLAIVWIIGAVAGLARRETRWLAAAGLVVIATVAALDGKAYYAAAIYPALFAAGAVQIERWTAGRPTWRVAMPALAIAAALPLLPEIVPVLPEPRMAAYMDTLRRLGLAPAPIEHHAPVVLGQIFADMHGWPELAAAVAQIRDSLPPELHGRARIFAANYGEASAVAVLGPRDLPAPLSGHNQYWYWGPGDWDGAALIDIGGDVQDDARLCAHARLAGTVHADWVMPYEQDLPIVLCTGLTSSPAALWPRLRHIE